MNRKLFNKVKKLLKSINEVANLCDILHEPFCIKVENETYKKIRERERIGRIIK